MTLQQDSSEPGAAGERQEVSREALLQLLDDYSVGCYVPPDVAASVLRLLLQAHPAPGQREHLMNRPANVSVWVRLTLVGGN